MVASGESVAAGDVVSFLNDYVQKGFVAGDSITFGSEHDFNPATTYWISAAALSSTKFVLAYTDNGNSNYGTAIIGDVSGNTITYGSEYVFNSASTTYISVAVLSSTKFVVAYRDTGNSDYGTTRVGNVSGNSITYGSEYVFNTANSLYMSAAALSATKFVVAYLDGYNNYDTAIIGDVSGNSITYGSEYVFNSASTSYISVAVLSSTKFVVAYQDKYDCRSGTAVIGDVSGNGITYGSEYVFNSASTWYTSVTVLSSTKFVVAYTDEGNSYYGTSVIGDVSGNTITFGSEYWFSPTTQAIYSIAALSSTKFVMPYWDAGGSGYGTAVIGDTLYDSVVGIAKESGTEGQAVPVIIGGVSDVHSGLTPGEVYYAAPSGDLTTDGTDYRVGLAISSIEILLDSDRDNVDQFFGDMVFKNNFRITEASSYQGLILKNQLDQEILAVSEDGDLNISGSLASQGLSTAIVQVTQAYSIGDNDSIITCDASSGAFIVTLPMAVGIEGRQYTVKKTDSTGNAVTLDPWGTEMVDGSFSYRLDAQWKYITIVSDGANWLILANN